MLDERGLVVACPGCQRRNRVGYSALGRLVRCSQCHAHLPPTSTPVEIPSAAVFTQLIEHGALPLLVDFWAPWCGPCKMVAPELEQVAATTSNQALIAKVNTESLPELARNFSISSIPTFITFSGGRERGRILGAHSASELLRFLRSPSESQ